MTQKKFNAKIFAILVNIERFVLSLQLKMSSYDC